jgi:hypothetical protein
LRAFREDFEASPQAALTGRRGALNVTSGRSLADIAFPTPFTSHNASIPPKEPAESRCATIRSASVGPIPGRASSSATDARSTSTGPRAVFVVLLTLLSLFDGFILWALPAESTRASWPSSAATFDAEAGGSRARQTRTEAPDRARKTRKPSAFRSLGEGITHFGPVDAATRTENLRE